MSADQLKRTVDFGILTIRDDEFRAVLKRFPEKLGDGRAQGSRRSYQMRRLELEGGDAYTVAILRSVEQGNGEALAATRDLLEDLAPSWIFVVGIAGGVPAPEFTLGDVVVSTRIVDFSMEALLKDGSHEHAVTGGPLHPAAADLAANLPAMDLGAWNTPDSIGVPRPTVDLSPANFYGEADWQKRVREAMTRHFSRGERAPISTDGAVASSDRLVKDADRMQVWLRLARQVRAVEMESGGVHRATHGRDVPFLAIRGISDVIGFNRDPAWIEYACNTAAALLRAVLLARLIPSRQSIRASQDSLNERIRALGEDLKNALARKERLEEHGEDSTEVRDEIAQLKHKMRDAGQLPAGYRLGKHRYLLSRPLGQGGFGAVWLALDTQCGKEVAIKLLHPNLAGDPERVDRFRLGAETMKGLKDNRVVRVLEPCVEEDGWHYFVMEYLPGGDLHKAVVERRIGPEQVGRLMLPVCDAVARAHAKGIVHRDIKPENILLAASGELKLTDFDLVSTPGSTGGTRGEPMGTFRYTAPEAADRPVGAKSDPREDVFSLGMTMVFALFGGDVPHEYLGHHDTVINALPVRHAVRDVLVKATHWGKNKDVRYQDAGALRDALLQATVKQSISQVLRRRAWYELLELLVAILFTGVSGLLLVGMMSSCDFLEKSYGHNHAVTYLVQGAAMLLGVAATRWGYVRFKMWLREETANWS